MVLSLFHIQFGIISGWSDINSDFPNYYTSSRLLLEGKDLSNIYDDNWFQKKISDYGIPEAGKFSPFPPPTAFILIPEALLNPISAKRVFLLLNLIALFITVHFITKISAFRYVGAFNLILLSGAGLANNFFLGQFYLILLLLILFGYLNLIKAKEASAGIIWGIGASVKYFPIVYFPIFILKRKWKAFFSLSITIILINIIALFIFGSRVYQQFLSEVFLSHLNGELSSQSKYATQFQSWNSFLRNVFVYDSVENNSPLYNSIILFHVFRLIVYFIFPAVSILIIYKLRNHQDFVPISTIILSLLVFVLSPASASYHILLLILPVVLLLNLSFGKYPYYALIFISLFSLIGFSPFLLKKINWQGSGLFFVYGRLWLEIILYLVSVWFILIKSMNASYNFNFRSLIPRGMSSTKEL
jgi:hypothetical protein